MCGVCYDVCIRPMRCSGPCKKAFCMKCVSLLLQKKGKCPYKCSQNFKTHKIPNFAIQFNCPYNSSQCKESIKSVKQFKNHFKSCKYINPQQLKIETYKDQYKCLLGHKLQFFVGTYQQMCDSTCVCCQDQKLVRSKCRICDQLYCVQCRVPTCSKQGCPVNHPFKYYQINSPTYMCDICGVSVILTGKGVRDDSLCNFSICSQCYEQLPNKLETTNIIESKDNQCDKGHNLKLIQKDYLQCQQKKCFSCQKDKFCPKYCGQCQKFYCLKCKNIQINLHKKCKKGHVFLQKQYQEQNLVANLCNFCNQSKQFQNLMIDNQCKIQLCKNCFTYLKKRTSNKARFFKYQNCKKGHTLKYLNNQVIYKRICAQCGLQKIIKLFCQTCTFYNQKYFCCSCREPPLKMCYLGHQLASIEKTSECCICSDLKKEIFWNCDQCFFNICTKCSDYLHQKSNQGQKKKQIEQIVQ